MRIFLLFLLIPFSILFISCGESGEYLGIDVAGSENREYEIPEDYSTEEWVEELEKRITELEREVGISYTDDFQRIQDGRSLYDKFKRLEREIFEIKEKLDINPYGLFEL